MNFDISKAVMWLFGQACPEKAKSKHWFSNRYVEKKKKKQPINIKPCLAMDILFHQGTLN